MEYSEYLITLGVRSNKLRTSYGNWVMVLEANKRVFKYLGKKSLLENLQKFIE